MEAGGRWSWVFVYMCERCYLQRGILGQVLVAGEVARSRRRNPQSRRHRLRLRNRRSRRQSHRLLPALRRLCPSLASPPLSRLHDFRTSWGQSHRLLLLERLPPTMVFEHRTLNAWIYSEKKLVNLTLSLVRWTTSRKKGYGLPGTSPFFSSTSGSASPFRMS